MRGTLYLLIVGLGGLAILLWLGFWQVQRLDEKLGIIADIDARIAAEPGPLPANPGAEADSYLPVSVTGSFGEGYLRVLVSQKDIGAGYRIISPFTTDEGRTIMVDRGFVPVAREDIPAPAEDVTLSGNLQWPREIDSFTPEPDLTDNTWFARDVPAMAAALTTEPILLVARDTSFSDLPVVPLPVDTSAIPNDHLQYAITWFSLAAIWAAMTVAFILRLRRTPKT
ncbi:SURF1 family protein [Sulfitobacter sp. S190]|uniref:SURF1 family protein n=1 Tax=Sulfitobacter sp. S190 TaxID=2867022 RepID=UPI0021A725E0|nr:SURF1 family protein [Sulfitobacter sp. S190]UWR23417.1 SURF1 family protein [Sulfitobacter sp. S190]